jgi:hypothetical protein
MTVDGHYFRFHDLQFQKIDSDDRWLNERQGVSPSAVILSFKLRAPPHTQSQKERKGAPRKRLHRDPPRIFSFSFLIFFSRRMKVG